MTPAFLDLIHALRALPGVGERTATRMAYNLLQGPESKALALSDAVRAARVRIRLCEQCHGFSEDVRCKYCAAPNRLDHILCVVETPMDLWTIEQTGRYRGRYHVLHGLLSPLDGVNVEDLTIDHLLARLGDATVTELFFALGGTPEADATARFLSALLPRPIKTTHLAYGIPLGAHLEYQDSGTLSFALEHRRELE